MSDDVHQDEPPEEVEAPSAGDLLGELPWAPEEPDDVRPFEDQVVASRRRRSRLTKAGLVVAGVALLAVASIAWLGGDDPSGSDPTPSTTTEAAPTTTTTEPPTVPPFEVTALDDGWFRVEASDGSMTADLPAEPRVKAAATAGLVYLVADLDGEGVAELLWAPQRGEVPGTLGPYLAMLGAGERYGGVTSSEPREVDGAVVMDGHRETATEHLRARSTSRAKAVGMVVLVVPADANAKVVDATWDRMIDTLELTG